MQFVLSRPETIKTLYKETTSSSAEDNQMNQSQQLKTTFISQKSHLIEPSEKKKSEQNSPTNKELNLDDYKKEYKQLERATTLKFSMEMEKSKGSQKRELKTMVSDFEQVQVKINNIFNEDLRKQADQIEEKIKMRLNNSAEISNNKKLIRKQNINKLKSQLLIVPNQSIQQILPEQNSFPQNNDVPSIFINDYDQK